MRRRSRATFASVLSLALVGALVSTGFPSRDAPHGNAFTVPGTWFGTTFFGDPNDPTTPRVQYAISYNRDGTFILDSTAETGQHPLFPGHSSVLHGVWTQTGMTVRTKGFWFGDGAAPPATMFLGRTVGEEAFLDGHTLSGRASLDTVLCPAGPNGCTDPTQGPWLPLGQTAQGTAFPTLLKRFRRP